MFTRININHPFYLTNSFDFESESETEDEITMSNTTNQATAASMIHLKVMEFLTANPIPEATYQLNKNYVRCVSCLSTLAARIFDCASHSLDIYPKNIE